MILEVFEYFQFLEMGCLVTEILTGTQIPK